MTLRLTGEEFSVVRGLDGLGYVRSILPSDTSPALKVQQSGTGPLLEVWDGATKVLYLNDGGGLVSERDLDVRGSLRNTGSSYGGFVHVNDSLWVYSDVYAADGIQGAGSPRVVLEGNQYALRMYPRGTGTYTPPTSYATLSFYRSGATHRFGILENTSDTVRSIVFDLDTLGSWLMGAHFFEGAEIADPAAPSADRGRLYFRDSGAGKTQLCVLFPTGAAQVVATEP